MEEDKTENNKNNGRRKKIAIVIFAALGAAGAVALFLYLGYKAGHISTDDAFVDGHVYTIASKIPGTVRRVLVDDNQRIKKGDLLVEIDPEDYEARVKETSSVLDSEEAKLAEVRSREVAAMRQLDEAGAAVATARADLQMEEATLGQTERDAKRAKALFADEAFSREQYEKSDTAYDVAKARVKAARERLREAEIAVETQKAFVRQVKSTSAAQQSTIGQRKAQLDTAQLNYGYTRIYAPADGYITKKSVEPGNQLQAGQPLMAVAGLGDIWVVANYKETQMKKISPGQKVSIKFDTYPDREFTGTVQSIMAGTGAVFSLFPPENATGQYVKVVQRIPVKIVLDKDTDSGHVLRIGMSAVPTVIVKR